MIALTNEEQLAKQRFYEILEAQRENFIKQTNNSFNHRYCEMVEYKRVIEIVEGMQDRLTKTNREYYCLRNYEVIKLDGVKRIIKKRRFATDPVRILVPYEELYDCLLKCHKAVDHKARDPTLKECSKLYWNLSIYLINLFISLCSTCVNKRRNNGYFGTKIFSNGASATDNDDYAQNYVNNIEDNDAQEIQFDNNDLSGNTEASNKTHNMVPDDANLFQSCQDYNNLDEHETHLELEQNRINSHYALYDDRASRTNGCGKMSGTLSRITNATSQLVSNLDALNAVQALKMYAIQRDDKACYERLFSLAREAEEVILDEARSIYEK